MSVKVDLSSKAAPGVQHIAPARVSPIIPDELVLNIFESLDFQAGVASSRVCSLWNKIVKDLKTVYGRYQQEVQAIKRLPSLRPIFTAWEPMPRHWGLITNKNVLKFSSIDRDIVAFHPPFCRQSSKFSSFTRQLPQFSDRCIFLARSGNTYFLTPQSQTLIRLELPTDLQPLVSDTLIAVNPDDPTKNRQFSLLRNLPRTPETLPRYQVTLPRYQVKECFPISETNIAILTSGYVLTFWDLSAETPSCYREFQMAYTNHVCRVGNYLIVDNTIADLRNPVFAEHGFDFSEEKIKTFSSSLCALNHQRKELRYFVVNDEGNLIKKWDFIVELSKEMVDDYPTFQLYLNDMNEEFIVLTCGNQLLILNTKGELIHHITPPIEDDLYSHNPSTCAHLAGNILTYKDPQDDNSIYFWHLPTKRRVQKFVWTASVIDGPLAWGTGYVQHIRLFEGKLTILLSSEHTPGSNKPGKYRLIQFDTASKPEIGGIIDRVISTVKEIYYSYPGGPL